jgi:hypothetical protein
VDKGFWVLSTVMHEHMIAVRGAELMNIDEELGKAAKDMEDAEDALAAKGLPEDQWMLIKKYVHAAIVNSQLSVTKALINLPLS